MKILLNKFITEKIEDFNFDPYSVYIVSKKYDIIKDLEKPNFNVGIDLYTLEEKRISPMQVEIIKTGVKTYTPIGFHFEVRPRSSTPIKTPLIIANSPGTIDVDYTGDIGLIVKCVYDYPYKVKEGVRLAQLCLKPYVPIGNMIYDSCIKELKVNYYLSKEIYEKWSDLIPSTRQDRGFGSSGGY